MNNWKTEREAFERHLGMLENEGKNGSLNTHSVYSPN